MRFTFTDKKVQVSDALRSYAEKKIGKLERFFRSEPDAFVTFSIERGRQIAEVTIKSSGMYFRASEATGDMYASIDTAVSSIERQIRKNKTRLEKRLRDGALEREFSPLSAAEDISGDSAAVVEESDFDVVRIKRFQIKPMSVDEAILQMNLLDHQFFVFLNQDSQDAFAVVYKRNNGGYGLIESDK